MSREEINAFLGAGTVYPCKLTFQGAVRVDGVFSGEISSEGALIAGKDAVIEARLDVGELILSGTFTGQVFAKRRVTVHKGGVLTGTVVSPALVVEEGAVIEGDIHMRTNPQEISSQAERAEALPEGMQSPVFRVFRVSKITIIAGIALTATL